MPQEVDMAVFDEDVRPTKEPTKRSLPMIELVRIVLDLVTAPMWWTLERFSREGSSE